MGILYDTVQLSQESKRQVMIQELLSLGVTDYKDQNIENIDFYTLRDVLAINKVGDLHD